MPDDTKDTAASNTSAPASSAATPPQAPAPEAVSRDMQAEMATILQEIKLPERRGPQATTPTSAPVFENKFAALETPPTPTEAPAAPAPEEGPKKPLVDIPSVRTLKDDLHTLVQDQKLSMVRASALEEDKRVKRDAAGERPPQTRGTPRIFARLGAALLLIVLGGLAFTAILFISHQRDSDVAVPLQSIMFSEQTLSFPTSELDARDLKNQLSLARSQVNLTLGAMARIVPTKEVAGADTPYQVPLTTEEFFSAIGARTPEGLARALSSEFFFGVHAINENMPVIVIPVTAYERAFAGLLRWETSINEDVAPIFSAVPATVVESDGRISPRLFEDILIQNYDVRVLKDSRGTIRMLYAFPTRNILIIAESTNTFVEALSRLRAERRL